MNILVTGSRGFVGRNLVENLKNIRDGKDQTRNVLIEDIYEYNRDTDPSLLAKYCAQADFIFHLAGVNRPKEPAEFMEGNVGFSEHLLQTLAHAIAGEQTKKCGGLLLASCRPDCKGVFGIPHTAEASWKRRDCFRILRKEQEYGCSFTVCPTFLASGADPTTTVPSPLFATISQTACPFR